eukprot:5700449-Alexandrium_andersonii.AAC.2
MAATQAASRTHQSSCARDCSNITHDAILARGHTRHRHVTPRTNWPRGRSGIDTQLSWTHSTSTCDHDPMSNAFDCRCKSTLAALSALLTARRTSDSDAGVHMSGTSDGRATLARQFARMPSTTYSPYTTVAGKSESPKTTTPSGNEARAVGAGGQAHAVVRRHGETTQAAAGDGGSGGRVRRGAADVAKHRSGAAGAAESSCVRRKERPDAGANSRSAGAAEGGRRWHQGADRRPGDPALTSGVHRGGAPSARSAPRARWERCGPLPVALRR